MQTRVRMPREIRQLKTLLFPKITLRNETLLTETSPREEDIKAYLIEGHSASRIIHTTKEVMREGSPIKDFLKESRRQNNRLD